MVHLPSIVFPSSSTPRWTLPELGVGTSKQLSPYHSQIADGFTGPRPPGLPVWPFGRQRDALQSTADLILYGGSKGGGKTVWLMLDFMKYAHLSGYKGILYRNSYEQIKFEILPRGSKYFAAFFPGTYWHGGEKCFKFPSGARLYMGYCRTDTDVLNLTTGAEFHWIGFDELTLFKRMWFNELTAMLRSSDDIPKRVRATTNPGGRYPGWVFKAFAPWLDPRSQSRARPDQVMHVLPPGDQGIEAMTVDPSPDAQSRQFIRSSHEDNPFLDRIYRRQLQNLTGVRRKELLDGDWLAGESVEGRALSAFGVDALDDEPLTGASVQYAGGIDHGQKEGHQTFRLLAYDVSTKHVQARAEWTSTKQTTSTEDARAICGVLSKCKLTPADVGLWVGDVNATFKSADAATCNQQLANAIRDEWERRTGAKIVIRIETPDKARWGIDARTRRMNDAIEAHELSVLRECELTRSDMGCWAWEDDDYKHGMDGLAYVAMPIFDRCRIQLPMGVPTGVSAVRRSR